MHEPPGAASYDPASHYDRVTPAWTLLLGDELHYGVFVTGDESLPDATGRLTDLMVDAAGLVPGAEVLDVGCGTGSPACTLAGAHGVRVTGITTSVVGVQAARAQAEAAGLSGSVRFEQRDAMDNGYPDGSFDRVWVLESSHLMRDRPRLMAECARVLRPGGRLALCDIVLARDLPFEEVRRRQRPLSLLRAAFGDARMETMARYAAMAEDEGLMVDRQEDLTATTRPTFARWRTQADAHRAEVETQIGAESWQDFVDSCAVLEQMWDENVLGYGLLAAAKPAG